MNSIFNPFPSSLNGTFDHLNALSDFKFSSEISTKIDILIDHEPGFIGELAKMFKKPLEELSIIDDFSELSSRLSLKICRVFTLIIDYVVSIPLLFLFIWYDKYGEDSMKRSLFNRINSQCAYPAILKTLLATPPWAYRIFFGPISSVVADIAVFIGKQ